ncbi:hypothetical protein OIE68_21085 [Nocardia vinacea]|nr:hypothetical protein OIE68_21085 [Nocardia vinacea]
MQTIDISIITGNINMYGLASRLRPIMAIMPMTATTITSGISLTSMPAGICRGISGGAESATSPPAARGGGIRGRRTKPSVAIGM